MSGFGLASPNIFIPILPCLKLAVTLTKSPAVSHFEIRGGEGPAGYP